MAQGRGLYLRVGALVLAGLALATGFILFFTANRIGRSADLYETYFRESVQGLEVGAPVRFRGVAIGRVTEIGLVAAEYRGGRGDAERSPFQLVFVRFAIDPRRTGETDSVENAIRQGLRVRIAAQGITGVNYLELDFVDPERFPILQVPWEPRLTYIPSIPSTVAQVQNAAEAILQQIQEADLPKLFANAIGLITDLRGQVTDGDLATTLRDASAFMAELRGVVQQAQVPALTGDLRKTVDEAGNTLAEFRRAATDVRGVVAGRELRQALANISAAAAELKTAAARLPNTISTVDGTARSARNTITDVQGDLAPLLRDLRAAVGNLRDVTEQLRRSPSQTIFGAPPPAPAENRR